MKILKITMWILACKPAIDLMWSLYKASKDGKVTKDEFEDLTNKMANLIKEIV
jgi:hypothetical protein